VNYARAQHFPARLQSLSQLRHFLESFCTEAGLGRDAALRLNIVLEELFVNTVVHGHRGDCDAPVWLTLTSDSACVVLSYEDTSPPYNPYGEARAVESTVQARTVGGLGVQLTHELAEAREYAYVFGRNRIRLRVRAA